MLELTDAAMNVGGQITQVCAVTCYRHHVPTSVQNGGWARVLLELLDH
jgi:hypothetical protein